jgi:hypothetical protein
LRKEAKDLADLWVQVSEAQSRRACQHAARDAKMVEAQVRDAVRSSPSFLTI